MTPVVRPSVCPSCDGVGVECYEGREVEEFPGAFVRPHPTRCARCGGSGRIDQPGSCPSCKSTDPKVCRWLWFPGRPPHPHGRWRGCCPDPFHAAPEGEK